MRPFVAHCTVSCVSAAAPLGREGPNGLVLISSVTRIHPYMRESLGDVPLDRIRVPTLIVHHRRDGCTVRRRLDSADPAVRGQARGARDAGGWPPPRGMPSGLGSPHAFLDLENVLIERVTPWIRHAPVR